MILLVSIVAGRPEWPFDDESDDDNDDGTPVMPTFPSTSVFSPHYQADMADYRADVQRYREQMQNLGGKIRNSVRQTSGSIVKNGLSHNPHPVYVGNPSGSTYNVNSGNVNTVTNIHSFNTNTISSTAVKNPTSRISDHAVSIAPPPPPAYDDEYSTLNCPPPPYKCDTSKTNSVARYDIDDFEAFGGKLWIADEKTHILVNESDFEIVPYTCRGGDIYIYDQLLANNIFKEPGSVDLKRFYRKCRKVHKIGGSEKNIGSQSNALLPPPASRGQLNGKDTPATPRRDSEASVAAATATASGPRSGSGFRNLYETSGGGTGTYNHYSGNVINNKPVNNLQERTVHKTVRNNASVAEISKYKVHPDGTLWIYGQKTNITFAMGIEIRIIFDGQNVTVSTVQGTINLKDPKIFDLGKKTLVTG